MATFKFMEQVITATNLAVDLKPIDISELPEDEHQSLIEGEAARIEVNRQFLCVSWGSSALKFLNSGEFFLALTAVMRKTITVANARVRDAL
ncbi:hypothetical protein ACK9YZ_24635 [Rhizobium sp. ZK1]|uniref:hypothetical protein n=1 Tax=Rhizobium sp. ZK1 TaxID=3389872 RepID=UPI0039F6758C